MDAKMQLEQRGTTAKKPKMYDTEEMRRHLSLNFFLPRPNPRSRQKKKEDKDEEIYKG